MKAFTDISQSRKLAEILPLESADMCFNISVRKNMPPLMIPYSRFDEFFSISPTPDFLIPCWSFGALLDIIPKRIKDFNVLRIDIGEKDFAIWYDEIGYGVNNDLPNITMESPVDACAEMIIKLHKQKLL